MPNTTADCIVIGGGFYGCCVALYMRQFVDRVVILEQGTDLLTRASYANQARVHNGYHYPRSFVTALRSRVNFPRFVNEFESAVHSDFTKVYAVAKHNSKVNAGQFKQFCQHIEADCTPAPGKIKDLFDPAMVEDVFLVKEYAFDAKKLAEILKRKLSEQGVEVKYQAQAESVRQVEQELIEITLKSGEKMTARWVFNCTYSQINTLLVQSGLERLPLKHEITEMALIDVPPELKQIGVTVMDGPFFSAMPFPARELHTLSHVRYTPQYSWTDQEEHQDGAEILSRMKQRSNFTYMMKDAQRFIPSLSQARQIDSLFEVKTVLMQNEVDDGRPILFRKDYGIKNFSVIMGGKIDNIYDILEAFNQTGNFGFT